VSMRLWERRSRVSLVALLGVLAVSGAVGRPAASATKSGPTRPNILLIVADDQRWETFTRALMPTVFSELVDKGVLLRRAYVNTPICCPSRSQLLTGLYEHHTGVDGNTVELARPTIVEALHGLGYRTMLAGKYLNSWRTCGPRPEFDNWICMGAGKSTYSLVNPTLNVNGTWQTFRGYTTDILADDAKQFIASTPSSVPFFLMYTPTSPHLPANDSRCFGIPVTPFRGPAFDEPTDTDGKPLYLAQPPMSHSLIANIDSWHERMTQAVTCLDNSLATLLASLGDREQNTLVVYLSDNGYLYGEHRRFAKTVPYDEAVRVPMVIRYPPLVSESNPFALDALAENVDIAPTIAGLVGIPWGADGKSLVPLLDRSTDSVRDALLTSYCEGLSYPCVSAQQLQKRDDGDKARSVVPSYWQIVTAQYAYIEYLTGEKELYDLVRDPAQLTNLAGDPAYGSVVADLAARLNDLRGPHAPDTTIVSGPSGPVDSRTVAFTYFTQSRIGRYRCRLTKDSVSGAWSACNGQTTQLGPLDDGSYTFEVAGTDETGATDPTPASRSFSIATSGPRVSITSGPPADGPPISATFAFSSPTPNVAYKCRLAEYGKQAAWHACDPSSPPVYPSLGPGLWSFEARATDRSGAGATTDPPAQWLFRFDGGGPTMTLEAAPHSQDQAASGAITFHPSEPLSGAVTCRLDSGPATDCTSGLFSYAGLADGQHRLKITARDLSGTAADTTFGWRIDHVPPVVGIGSGPSPYTQARTATLQFASSEKGPSYCRFDKQPFYAVCNSPDSFDGLADGVHTFSVIFSDQAKNFSTPAKWTWTVDTKPPTATITYGPPSLSTETSAEFGVDADDPTSTFTCTLDQGPEASCTSPVDYDGLADGEHVFAVRATDAAGNASPVVSYHWTVDATPPHVTIDSEPPSTVASADAEFRFSADDPAATFTCSLDAADYLPCESPADYTGLIEGAHAFAVRATDAAGNVSPAVTYGWTVDTTPPLVTVDSGPSDPTPATDAELVFTSDDPAAEFRCSLDGADNTACTSPVDYGGLAEGAHVFDVRATDAAGNTSDVVTYGWTVDFTSPGITIDSGPADPTASEDADFAFSSDDSSATFGCSLDVGDFAPCASPTGYTAVGEGQHVFTARATDAAGNTSEADFRWTVDETPPDASIGFVPADPSSSSDADFTFSSDDPAAAFSCSLDGAEYASCASPLDYTGLSDGSHLFDVRATDAAGNTGAAASFGWTVDTVPPEVTVDSAPPDPSGSAEAQLAFSSDDPGAAFSCSLDGGDYAACASPTGYSGLADGTHVFEVRATDAAGNASPAATVAWTVDTTPPGVAIDSAPTDPSESPDASFAFSSDDAAATFECSLDGATFSPCTSPIAYTGLADGSHFFSVQATDAAGNVSSPATWFWTIQTG
jgi:arylsulfatase A-like enzyme